MAASKVYSFSFVNPPPRGIAVGPAFVRVERVHVEVAKS